MCRLREPLYKRKERLRQRKKEQQNNSLAGRGCAGRCGDYLGRSMSVLPTEPLQILEPGAAAHGRNDLRRNLIGLSRDGLKAALAEAGSSRSAPPRSGTGSIGMASPIFGRMSNIAKKTRDRLADQFVIERPSIVTEQRSVDGTRNGCCASPTATRPRRSTSPNRSRLGLRSSQVAAR